MHIFGSEPQRSGTLRNTTLPGQPVTSARPPNISTCNPPELNTAAPQRPKGTFDVHLPIKASNPRGHDNAPFIIGNSHQLALVEIIARCRQGTCKGKIFSTFSNLLRHEREIHGKSAKVPCTLCGAKFTRTTARNTHQRKGVCSRSKQKRLNPNRYSGVPNYAAL